MELRAQDVLNCISNFGYFGETDFVSNLLLQWYNIFTVHRNNKRILYYGNYMNDLIKKKQLMTPMQGSNANKSQRFVKRERITKEKEKH